MIFSSDPTSLSLSGLVATTVPSANSVTLLIFLIYTSQMTRPDTPFDTEEGRLINSLQKTNRPFYPRAYAWNLFNSFF